MASAIAPGALRIRRQLLEPFQRAADFAFRESGSFQFVLERVAVGFGSGLEIGVEVILEEIDQNIENAFLHFAALRTRRT